MTVSEIRNGSQVILTRRGRHVSIWIQDKDVSASFWVGSPDFADSHITTLAWRGRTEAGARRWAMKMFEEFERTSVPS